MTGDGNREPESELLRSIGRTARRVLAIAGYTQLVQLTAVSEAELLRLLREALAAQGLAFAQRDP